MPGFMQSFKSPFNPHKKNATVIAPEVVVSTEEGTVAQEQPSSEVLPGEALVPQTSSTVALTLTPANGESSQQLPSDNAEVIDEPIAQSDVVESEPVPEESTDPTEPAQSAASPSAAAQDTPEGATSVISESNAAVVEPSSDLAEEVAHTSVPEAVEPQASSQDIQSNEEPDAAVPSEEPARVVVADEGSNDVAPTPTEDEASKPAPKANKEGFSCNIKRNKSKKQKADASPEVKEAGQSLSTKPRKSHPLTDKFRNVIEQVRSKVKKDKETVLTPPAVEVIESTPIVEEIAASA